MEKDLQLILELILINKIIYDGISIVSRGLCKILNRKPKVKYIDQRKYEKCPHCGKEFTFFNYGVFEEGACYSFCECGYDSREEE